MEAVRAAALDVAAGEHELVLAIGAEKMRDVTSRGSLVARTANLTHPTIAKGRTAPGQFALLANAYMERFGVARETLARVAVKNHEHATRNPKAHFRTPDHGRGRPRRAARRRAVRHARLHADDRRRRRASCSPRSPGRASTPSATRSSAASASPSPGGYYTTFFDPRRTTSSASARRARRRASPTRRPGSTTRAAQLDLVECHDCFTVTELVNTEDLGLCGRGEGGGAPRERRDRRSAATSRSTSPAASSRAATRSAPPACG